MRDMNWLSQTGAQTRVAGKEYGQEKLTRIEAIGYSEGDSYQSVGRIMNPAV